MFENLKKRIAGFVDKLSGTELSERSLEELLGEFKLVLIENDVAYEVAAQICARLKEQMKETPVPRFGDKRKSVRSALRDVLLEILKAGGEIKILELVREKRGLGEPAVIIFVGINGTGKTTTIAKVARYLVKNGCSVVVACADTYRTGSIEQLEEHARRVGVRTIRHQYGGDPAAVAFDAVSHAKSHGIDAVLIDTAGRIQTDRNLMKEMEKIVRVSQADLVMFVGDALAGNDAVSQAQEFIKYVRVDGTILTKLDADARGGSALSVAYITQKPVLFFGTGQGYDDLESFDPERLVDRMIGPA